MAGDRLNPPPEPTFLSSPTTPSTFPSLPFLGPTRWVRSSTSLVTTPIPINLEALAVTLPTPPFTSLATFPLPIMQTTMPPFTSSTANHLPAPNLDPSGASISTTTTTAINFLSAATKKLKPASARPSATYDLLKGKAWMMQLLAVAFDACDNQLNFVTNNHKKITLKALPNSEHDSPARSVVKFDVIEDAPYKEAFSSGASAGIAATPDVTSESYLRSSSTLTEMVPPKNTSSNRTAKEFKLNPGAKIFSPSFAHQRSVTPPVVPTATCIPDNSSVVSISTAHPEVEISPFAPRSLPMKFILYGSLASGNYGSDIQYPQPICTIPLDTAKVRLQLQKKAVAGDR